jgi:flagellar basal body P-ring formation protein FlgA
MLFRQTAIVTLLMCAVPIPGLAASAEEAERTTLCQAVTLRAPVVRLSDLLPSETPSSLRARAAEIVLGRAPQPGLSRTVSGMEIKSRLIDAPELLERLTIPDRIVIKRSCRSLSTSELLQVIQLRLGAQTTPDSVNWSPSDLTLSTPVYVTLDDPGLEVTRVELDPLRRQTKFRLWTSKEPSILPFWVTLAHDVKVPTLVARHDIPAGREAQAADFQVEERAGKPDGQNPVVALDPTGLQTRAPVKSGQAVTRSMLAPVVLVEPGRPAKLVAEGAHYRISTTVIPLQAGVLGQQIRVREVDSQHILSAEVVGPGELKANP